MTLVGVLGGGQLGRMLALAGHPLGLRFRFLDPAPDCPAARLGEHVCALYDGPDALERFAADVDVVTYEFENVPVAAAMTLAARLPVFPGPQALEVAQDRLVEKTFLGGLDVPTAPFVDVADATALAAAVERIGLPAVLKSRRQGYDGRGQILLRGRVDLDTAWSTIGAVPAILEGFVPFARELSMLAVRCRAGDVRFYPLVENTHAAGILRTSIAPAPQVDTQTQATAEAYATRVLEALDYVGVLAVELFALEGGGLLVNEIAPRVHNSGHWTIEGAETSQFENHLRAICGMPLGSTAALGHSAMINLIGTLPDRDAVLRLADAHLHLYDKDPRPGRKLGHVTVRALTAAERDARVAAVQAVVAE